MKISPRILQAHCQSHTSPSTDQSFVKELAKPTQEKLFLKNFPTLQKKNKSPKHIVLIFDNNFKILEQISLRTNLKIVF